MPLVTLHTYTPTTWTNGSTAVSAATMSNLETGVGNLVTDLNAHQQAATLDHPAGSVQASHMASGAATDTVIGNRTPNDGTTAASGAQTLLACLSMLANMIKQITGGAHWYTAPVTTIAALQSNKIDSASAGGGSAGNTMWEGTTDPGGSASEGDMWAKG